VQKFSRDRDALGRRVRQRTSRDVDPPWATIVGVIADLRGYGLDQPALPEIYWPLLQRPDRSTMSLVVRTKGDPSSLIPAARAAMAELDSQQPIFDVEPVEDLLASSLSPRRFTLILMVLFGLIALVLAAVGIYGVMAYTVAQRTQEIGIRMALGARPLVVLGMVLKDGMALVGVGLVVGVIGALALGRVVASLLYGTSTTDAPTFAVIAAALALVALAALVIPARRATRIDPISALRSE
jgi:ABC-type antimicrobial peptide transport system permease subunit